MGSSDKTVGEEYPQFLPDDKPSWLGDINPAFAKIDSGMRGIKRRLGSLESNLANVVKKAIPRLIFTTHDEPHDGTSTVRTTETANGYVIDLGIVSGRDGATDYAELENVPVFSPVATSGQYNDLVSLPDLQPVALTGDYDDLSDKPNLQPVALTGSYDDLTDKPNLTSSFDYASNVAVDALSGLKITLDAGARSTAIQVMSDSTSNDVTDWPYLLAQKVAADYPDWSVRFQRWNDTADMFDAPFDIQTGPEGELYLDCSTGTTSRQIPPGVAPHFSDVIDIRLKMSRGVWTTTAPFCSVLGASGASGENSWYTLFNTNTGRLQFIFSTDGTTTNTLTSTVAPSFADGTVGWVRWVFTPDNGASEHGFAAYESTDGVTWTQLGSTIVGSGVVSVFDNTSTRGIALGNSAAGGIGDTSAKIYHVEIRDGLNGPSLVPALPDLWQPYTSGVASSTAGSPVFTVVNGGKAGGDIAYLIQPSRLQRSMPNFGQAVTFLSQSHNMGVQFGEQWSSTYKAFINAVQPVRSAPLVVLTQNPEKGSAPNKEWHAQRAQELPAIARRYGLGCIDTYQMFADMPTYESTLMADDVHPNVTGSGVWADLIYAVIKSASS